MNLFDWLRPEKLRARKAPDVERNTALLARLQESDPVYRCLMDHACVQFENDTLALLQPKLSASDREYLAGRASALAAFISTIEHRRERLAEIERQAEESPRKG